MFVLILQPRAGHKLGKGGKEGDKDVLCRLECRDQNR